MWNFFLFLLVKAMRASNKVQKRQAVLFKITELFDSSTPLNKAFYEILQQICVAAKNFVWAHLPFPLSVFSTEDH